MIINDTVSAFRIGFAIAKRLGLDGAKVVISSRKQPNVDRALDLLKKDNINAIGLVCHVAKEDHRRRLFEKVIMTCHISFLDCVFCMCSLHISS